MNDYKLIICVYACDKIPKYISQIETINNTWGKLCTNNIKLLYFLGEKINPSFVGERYINLPAVNDDYMSASYKQFLGLKYIQENYKSEFVICCGTDTYLNIPKLLGYINTFDYTKNLYIGGHGCERQIGPRKYYFHSGGPGFIITQKCLENIYPQLGSMVEEWKNVCEKNNVDLSAACDVAISYYLQQENMNTKIIKTNDLSFINCNYKGQPCHVGQINQANIVSCHCMSIPAFYEFTKLLEENKYFM